MALDELIKEGKYAEAMEILRGRLKERPDDPDTLFRLACLHSLSGEVEKALESLRAAVLNGYDDYIQISIDTDFEGILGLPQYREMIDLARKRLEERMAREQLGRVIRLREREWTDVVLRHHTDEHPSADLSLSFDTEALRIRAAVYDLHFKDGNRSWRYGDGFFINFVMPERDEMADSDRFYSLGFSLREGKPIAVLVNRNGTYYLSNVPGASIEIEAEGRRALYSISLPWPSLAPFRPLMDERAGINILYISQNDDRSKKYLKLVDDPHYDSERTDKRRFVPLYFEQSPKSELQFMAELESRLLDKPEIGVSLVAYSPEERDVELSIEINGAGGHVVKIHVQKHLKKGKAWFKESIKLKGLEEGIYTLAANLEGANGWTETFYKYDNPTIPRLKDEIENLEEDGDDPLLKSSVCALRFRLSEIEEKITGFQLRDDPEPLSEKVDDLRMLIERTRDEGSIYNITGYLRTAYVSPIDGALQPYSLFFPEGFSPDEPRDLLVMLHGSGVDEVWTVKKVSGAFGNFLVVGPRGRWLSDFWVGDSERDALDVIRDVRGMFRVGRIILAGFSMGGYGSWRLSFLHPGLFDGVIVIAGTLHNLRNDIPEHDMHNHIGPSKGLPYLVIHGTDDHSSDIRHTDKFVELLREEGYDIEYVRVEGGGHGNFDPTGYVREWLAAKFGK